MTEQEKKERRERRDRYYCAALAGWAAHGSQEWELSDAFNCAEVAMDAADKANEEEGLCYTREDGHE